MNLNLSRYLSIKHWIIFISFRFRILVACILHTSTFNHRESRNQALASILRSSFLFIDVFKHQYSFHRTTIIIIHEDSKSLWLEELAMFGVFGMFFSLIEMYIYSNTLQKKNIVIVWLDTPFIYVIRLHTPNEKQKF